LIELHVKRASALLRAVSALLVGGVTSLSAIALCLEGSQRLKHRIKSVDRLLSNDALHGARSNIYALVARRWLAGLSQVLLVIDWSDMTADQRWQWLRASVVVEARSVTLYEEVHPQKRLGNPQVHRRFLRRVAAMLPRGCTPIVMTDAGFRSSWFQLVRAQGWLFVGRVRGRDQLQPYQGGQWVGARDLFVHATTVAQDLGQAQFVRSNPVTVHLVLIKRPAKGRHRFTVRGIVQANCHSARSAKRQREPWLLAASPGLNHLGAESIVALYAQRMRIEESFRDTKNLRFGLGLQTTRTRSAKRLEMLLLLAHLASFVQRLIGEQAKGQQLELNFVSTIRAQRAEISVLTLGRRILDAPAVWLRALHPWRAIPPLTSQAAIACSPTP